MAAHALQSTSKRTKGDVSAISEKSIDYVEWLRVSLTEQKLIYIVNIMDEEGVSLDDLFDWSKSDILEALRDIHNNDQNQHQIQMLHRNKFAKIVIGIAGTKQIKTDLHSLCDEITFMCSFSYFGVFFITIK
eukprot:301156_1